MRLLRFLLAIPVVFAMVILAKAAQLASVNAFGASLGFTAASLIGLLPVIGLYVVAAIKLPHIEGITR